MRVHLTTAPDGAFPSDLARLHRQDLATVYVHTSSSDGSSAGARAMTVLEALGKSVDVTGAKDHSSENTALLPVWLTAHGTKWVIFPDPSQSRPRTLHRLLSAMASCSTDLLAVDRVHSHERTAEMLDRYDPSLVDWSDVERKLRPPVDGAVADLSLEPVVEPSAGYVVVPSTDWPTFRADCRTVLTSEQFAAADADYRQAYRTARAFLDGQSAPSTETTRLHLAANCLDARTAAQATVRIRATQAAFFTHGWNLRVDRERLISRLAQIRQLRLEPPDFVALRAYRDPVRAALCILHDAGIPKRRMTEVTVVDVETAATTGTLNGLTLTSDATPFLTAAIMHRRRTTTDPHAPLFPITQGTATAMLNRASRDLGLFVGAAYTGNNANTMNYWQYRDGFLLGRVR